jgi:hypothetical protein
MTLVNIIAGAVYTKGFETKDKIQLYGMALVFLLLLYNSPAGLVLYWTFNNIFSFLKICIQKIRYSKTILYYVFVAVAVILEIGVLFFHKGYLYKRFIVAFAITIFLILMIFIKAKRAFLHKIILSINLDNTAVGHKGTFICSAVILFLLSGLAIPASLIASSTIEFSFIHPYTSPLPFIGTVMLQSMGFFLFWCPVIYFLFSKKIKILLTLLLSLLSIITLLNAFAFPGDYGFITPTLLFSDVRNLLNPEPLSMPIIFNLAVIVFVAILCVVLILSKYTRIFYSIQAILIMSLTAFSIGYIIKINTGFSDIARVYKPSSAPSVDTLRPVYHFSRNGKNVIIIMLDRGISGFIPHIFGERPDLQKSFSGFTWYPNCVSLGGYTLLGLPSLFGGYEYSPVKMQEKNDRLLVEKYNEALLVLPKLFSENGFSVTITDPSYANFSSLPDLTIYDRYDNVHAENLRGRFLGYWQKKHPEVQILSIPVLLKNNLSHFSFFRMSPLLFRGIIYDKGNWLITKKFSAGDNDLPQYMLDNYAHLDVLPEITNVDDTSVNTYTAIVNELTHEPTFFQAPMYVPSNTITNRGDSIFADETDYHVNMAALILLGKWFDYLKQQNVYDNSRIIIASDHGWYLNSKLKPNFVLPNGTTLITFNSLLMVKDFLGDAIVTDTEIKTDNAFMTQADVPYLASKDITNAVNPFTQSPLFHNKADGITIATVAKWEDTDFKKSKWAIHSNQWLHVHDNIFDPNNWEKAGK